MLINLSHPGMIRALPMTAIAALSGCAQTNQAVDALARSSAKLAVSETLTTRLPGVPKQAVRPFTDCVIDNSSAREIATFASAAVTGVTEETATQVRAVLERPDTQNCIFQAGLNTLTP
ncbi:MAG: hypothetical protein ABJI96_19395 [Paracoccaceae bacterium]